jgi:Fe/S biogenesis protein NfuA
LKGSLKGATMITFTDEAKQKVREYMDMAEGGPIGVRLLANRLGRHRFQYNMALVMEGEAKDDDLVQDEDSFKIFVDSQSGECLEGTTVDFVSDFSGSGFRFDNPQAVVTWENPVAQRVQQIIDEKISPSLAGHGGWVELLDVEGDAAIIQFGGGCHGCGMSQVTLKDGIEAAILQDVPEIKRVLDNTDHDTGQNPYYSR